ncbi:hypothetical protein DB30_05653 [Enhygromyxa salina]|uniref:Uncharacterized protein n=1 Tax=Enhygromyxa salina TaxID=215803 RepID=A0A0C2D0L2_9BACT|nr:hypothetical protein [Enhygromyxa salina]KIG15390.1 hypothetical protein DB30_05653 [Enhygromyxa salina]
MNADPADHTHHTFCRICEALCGLEVTTEGQGAARRITKIRPAADGAAQLEQVSGMAHLTGFVVDVTPAAGTFDPSS